MHLLMRILAIALRMVPGHATSSSLSAMSLTSENRGKRGQEEFVVAYPDKYGKISNRYIYHMQKVSIAVIQVTHLKPNLKKCHIRWMQHHKL